MANNTNPNPHRSDDPSPAAPANAKGQWPGAFTAFTRAFDQLKKNPQPALLFLGAYAALVIISSVAQDGVSYFSTERWNYEDILYLVFLLALPVYSLALADRKVISLGEFMRFDATKYFTLFGMLLLYALEIFGSVLLLLVPLIWTVAWFSLIPYTVVDKGTGVIDAFKESKRLVQNHKAKVWGAIGVTVLYSIIATIVRHHPLHRLRCHSIRNASVVRCVCYLVSLVAAERQKSCRRPSSSLTGISLHA